MIFSTTRQIQIIADMLRTETVPDLNPADLDDPWCRYFQWIAHYLVEEPDESRMTSLQRIAGRDLKRDFTRRFHGISEDGDTSCDLVLQAIHNPIVYRPASQLLDTLPDLRWLWPGWIPLGLVSLLAAVPGTGKSYFALDLAHRIVIGTHFPDGSPVPVRGRVLYVDAENTPSIFKKRVQVWDPAELDRLYLMLPDDDRLVINLDDPFDRDRLWDMVWKLRPALVILDSYGSATLRGENNKEDVQQLLAFLNQLAHQHEAGMLIIHHLRKRLGPQTTFMPMTIDSIRGSSHIPAMARNVLGLQWMPAGEHLDENGPRRLWIMKSNIGRYPEPLGVYFDPHPACPDVAMLTYGEAPTYREPTKSDRCAEWLQELLRGADKPMRPRDVIEIGQDEGYNERMIYRVRGKLSNVRDTEDDSHHPDNSWRWVENDEL